MDEYNNLPFGASPFDAYNAGVNSSDDPHIAASKLVLHDIERANAAAREQSYAGQFMPTSDASPEYLATGGVWSSAARDPQFDQELTTHHASMMGSHNLVKSVEEKRQMLERQRESETRIARNVRRAAIAVAVVTAWIAWFGINLPFVSYKHIFAEYIGVRIMLIASIVCIFKASSRIKKAFSDEEKRLTTTGECIIQALKKSGGLKKKGDTFPSTRLLGRVDVPTRDLTPKFLVALNESMLQATGKPMPYSVYRFREEKQFKRAFFISYDNVLRDITKQISDPVSMEELKQLAA